MKETSWGPPSEVVEGPATDVEEGLEGCRWVRVPHKRRTVGLPRKSLDLDQRKGTQSGRSQKLLFQVGVSDSRSRTERRTGKL